MPAARHATAGSVVSSKLANPGQLIAQQPKQRHKARAGLEVHPAGVTLAGAEETEVKLSGDIASCSCLTGP